MKSFICCILVGFHTAQGLNQTKASQNDEKVSPTLEDRVVLRLLRSGSTKEGIEGEARPHRGQCVMYWNLNIAFGSM